jgi:hypothetical protein
MTRRPAPSLQGPRQFAFGQPMVEDNSSEHQTSAAIKAATVLPKHHAGAAKWARNAAQSCQRSVSSGL